MKVLHRRTAICTVLAAAAGLSSRAMAQAPWPARPIRLIVPLAAGGPTDLLARIISQPLSTRLGQPIVIENRPGAGGSIGAEVAAKADPDGYTLFLGTSGTLSINQSLYSTLRYDPVKEFAPIRLAASAPYLVVVHPSVPARTLQELVAYAKAHPGKLNYGIVPGGAAQLAVELFKRTAGIDIVGVSYKGAALATNDLIAGQIEMSFASTPGALSYVKSGKLRALAVTSPKRLDILPDLPTVAECGLPGYAATVWYGVVAPVKTPTAIIDRLYAELSAVLKDEKVRASMAQNDFYVEESNPAAFGRFIAAEAQKWAQVVKASGMKAE